MSIAAAGPVAGAGTDLRIRTRIGDQVWAVLRYGEARQLLADARLLARFPKLRPAGRRIVALRSERLTGASGHSR